MASRASVPTADGENAARLAGKPADAAAARPATRGRSALGDVSNQPRAPLAAGAKPATAARSAGASAAALEPTLAERGIVDIDELEAHNEHACTDYVGQIYAHFKATEVSKAPRHGYMAHQTDINEKMRSILIDWLFEVHQKFKLMPETLYLTVNLIDRFLERKLVIRQKLQLVGVTAMLLASKYEEIYAPEVRDFVYITDKAYTREQILAMEAQMLNTLDFKVTAPTAYVFLSRTLKASDAAGALGDLAPRVAAMATYVLERCLQEYRMLVHPPSKLAAASVNIAMRTLLGRDAWNLTLAHFSGYAEVDLTTAIKDAELVIDAGAASSLQAVRKKYSLPRYLEVASVALARLD